MRYTRLMMIALSCALFLGGAQAVQSGGAEPFIKPDLSNWEGLKEYWTYEKGALVGATPKGLKFNTFLCSRKKCGDFEMSFQVRLKDAAGNSGVQIRSKIINPSTYAVGGPQADIGGGYWGSLYGEQFGGMMKQSPADIVQKVLKPKDFNDYSIRCVGDNVTIKLNGQVTVDEDFPKMPKEGIIAFQLHAGGPMEVTFRKIRFKELKGGTETPEKLPTPKETTPVTKPQVAPSPKVQAGSILTPATKASPRAAERIPAPAAQPGTITNVPPDGDPETNDVPGRRGLLQRLFQRLRR
jgi:hypothetical protein